MQPTDRAPANVIWLASYPKTGSTWLRQILSTALNRDDDRRAETIPSFQKAYPVDPPVYTLLGQRTHLVKTHLHPGEKRMALCPDRMIGVITIRRHPLDVLLSALNYARVKETGGVFLDGTPKTVEQIIADGEFQHYIDQFHDNDGFPSFSGPCGEMSLYMQRWRDHAAAAGVPYHEICYEDMFADPETEIRRLLDFLGLTPDEAEIQQIYRKADRRTAQNGEFFWKRRAYNFQDLLPDGAIRAFHAKCAPQLAAMDYPAAP